MILLRNFPCINYHIWLDLSKLMSYNNKILGDYISRVWLV